MLIIYLLKNITYFFFKLIVLFKTITTLKIFQKKVLYFFISIFINFFFFTEIAFCETEDFNNDEIENKYIIQKIILICILSAFIFGGLYFLSDGFTFPNNNNNNFFLTEEELEKIKKLEEAQALWTVKPKNIEYARICPQILYNCDIPPGIFRDIGVYDYLYGV